MLGRRFRPSLRRLVLRGSVSGLLASGLLLGASPVAHAADTDLVCSGGGSITVTKVGGEDVYNWLMTGTGSCTMPNHPAQVRSVTLDGKATTAGLGFCSGDGVIPDFTMSVNATFVLADPLAGAITTLQAQQWQLPATTYPVISAFQLTDAAGNGLGAGELETHIFAKCPPDGQPTMQVNWTQPAPD